MMYEWVDVEKLAQSLNLKPDAIQKILQQQQIENESESEVVLPELPQSLIAEQDITIHHADFITASLIEPETIDLVVTSPPYNVGIDYSQHNDTESYADYLAFSEQWLNKAYQLARPDGRLCMNIPLDKNKGGQQSICADITSIAKKLGWKYHSTIIWNEGNISRRTAWGSWMSASAPYVIAPVEVIVVMYKEVWKKIKRPDQHNDITRKEFMDWTNGVWTFNGESKKRIGHPAPFPRELPRRCIKLFSFVGDVVLDPFLGSGTTLVEASACQRKGVGFDISLEYCELAKKRLNELWKQPKLL
jgi:site-specific DNA-methyltransferase (adenine-specific)